MKDGIESPTDLLEVDSQGERDGEAGAIGVDERVHLPHEDDPRLNHRFESIGGVMAEECGAVLRRFFGELRAGRARRRGGA